MMVYLMTDSMVKLSLLTLLKQVYGLVFLGYDSIILNRIICQGINIFYFLSNTATSLLIQLLDKLEINLAIFLLLLFMTNLGAHLPVPMHQ